MGWALLTLLKISTVDGISKTLVRLDTTPRPRFPDQASAIQGAAQALKLLPSAPNPAARRSLLLTARNHLSGCVTAYELDQLQVIAQERVRELSHPSGMLHAQRRTRSKRAVSGACHIECAAYHASARRSS